MKKTSLMVIAALLALAIFSCDFGPAGEEPVYNEFGQRMVQLSIGAGGRALTLELAQMYVNYFEVVFKNDTNLYRKSWYGSGGTTMYVPVGTYSTTNPVGNDEAAIIFAGYLDPNSTSAKPILLATGDLTSGPITASTTTAEFTLNALTADIAAAPSAFAITTSSFVPGKGTIEIEVNGANKNFPLFTVKKDGTNTATYTVTTPNSNGVMIASVGTLAFSKVLARDAQIFPAFQTPVTPATTGAIMPDSGAVSDAGTGGVFILEFDVPDAAGIASLSFEIPVRPLDAAAGIDWLIQGGLRNAAFDTGVSASEPLTAQMGGQILITSVDAALIGITTVGP